eukprot:scaffold73724_cov63-Phaeocystis_antarctica.AAC.1
MRARPPLGFATGTTVVSTHLPSLFKSRGVTTAAAAEQALRRGRRDPPAAGLQEAVALPPGLD